jgi:hypothetical protein
MFYSYLVYLSSSSRGRQGFVSYETCYTEMLEEVRQCRGFGYSGWAIWVDMNGGHRCLIATNGQN